MSQQIEFTVGGLLDDIAARFPDNEALVYVERGLRYTYRQFNERCRQVAKGLLRMGVKKGDHVSIWAYNVPEWVVLQFATAKIGAVLVTVNTSYKSAELEYILKQSDSSTLFLVKGFKDTDYVKTLNEVTPELPGCKPCRLESLKLPFLKNVVFIGAGAPAGMTNFDAMVEMGQDVSDAEFAAAESGLSAHDVINMQYTSGTTGFPKGVMLTHYNVVNNGFNIGECMELHRKGPALHPGPVLPLLRLRARRDGVRHPRLDHGAGGNLRPAQGPADDRKGALHRGTRRADHVHRRAGASGVRAHSTSPRFVPASWPAPTAPSR